MHFDDLRKQVKQRKNLDSEFEAVCPQCGESFGELLEGYCRDCTEGNYAELHAHDAQQRWWESLSEEEKQRQVDNQLRFTC